MALTEEKRDELVEKIETFLRNLSKDEIWAICSNKSKFSKVVKVEILICWFEKIKTEGEGLEKTKTFLSEEIKTKLKDKKKMSELFFLLEKTSCPEIKIKILEAVWEKFVQEAERFSFVDILQFVESLSKVEVSGDKKEAEATIELIGRLTEFMEERLGEKVSSYVNSDLIEVEFSYMTQFKQFKFLPEMFLPLIIGRLTYVSEHLEEYSEETEEEIK